MLPQYTSPGSYTILYLAAGDKPLCAECATKLHDEGGLVTGYAFDEGDPIPCEGDDCDREIESSYGPVGGEYISDDNVPLGDIPTLTGREWLTAEDFTHLRAELEQLQNGGDAPRYLPVDTAVGRVFLHKDGRVERVGKILHTFGD